MSDQLATPKQKSIATYKAPREFYDLLETPSFAPTEDPQHFHLVVERMLEEIRPSNFLEVLITLSLIDAIYEELRLRHVREAMKAVSRGTAVEALLFRRNVEEMPVGAEQLMRAQTKAEYKEWRDNRDKRAAIEDRLNKSSGGEDFAILVQTSISNFMNRDAVERAIAIAQRQRMALLRDLDFCRERKKKAQTVADEIVRTPATA